VEEHKNGEVEVTSVDPIASMISVDNEALGDLASEVWKNSSMLIESLN
jgi:hypothetical protein